MVNLEQWVGQEVLVTYSNGETGIYKVRKSEHSRYYYCINHLTYTPGGFYHYGSDLNIIKIQPINKKEELMVNLEDWVGQEVLVTYEDGTQGVGKIIRNFNIQTNFDYLFLYLDNRRGWESYTKDGFKWHSKCSSRNNIIKIQPMNKKEQLKQQIKALEAELKSLEVPEGFDEELAYKFLNGNKEDGLNACAWSSNTREGEDYWVDISVGDREPTDKNVIQLQKWIIESYRWKLGLDS